MAIVSDTEQTILEALGIGYCSSRTNSHEQSFQIQVNHRLFVDGAGILDQCFRPSPKPGWPYTACSDCAAHELDLWAYRHHEHDAAGSW